MKLAHLLCTAALAANSIGVAFGWGSNGHQTVGAVADAQLAGTKTYKEVQAILGKVKGKQLRLQDVAVWADCARSIQPNENFKYDPGKFKEPACNIFTDKAGVAQLADYVRNNNTNCDYAGKPFECHKSFHFDDVSIQHKDYKDGLVGTNNHDVVHGIAAALAVLNGKDPAPPFKIANKREALMLLVHFVGDLHQPLHVAAVYLDKQGKVLDPATYDPATDTHGGNSINGEGGELHGQWDKTTFKLDRKSITKLIGNHDVDSTPGSYDTWAPIWAGDTLKHGPAAFNGLSFGAEIKGDWPMTFADRNEYVKNMTTIQEAQAVKGGIRLANLLKAVFPD